MNLGLQNRIALVTGGAQGIGSAITTTLLKEGALVIYTSRNAPALEEFQSGLPAELQARAFPICNDLTGEDSIDKLCAQVYAQHGHIDILVNNAGHTLNVTNPHCSLDDWRSVMRLNFEVPVELSRQVIPAMRKRGWGRIVNITSCAGLENSGPVTFCAAKAALTAYTRSMGRVLATEGGQIVMSAVFPGVVATKGGHWEKVLKENPAHAEKYLEERCPLRRFGEIDEVSPIVAIYCSDLASFSHGAIIPVDGGQSKHFMSFNYME
jgi:NAD(P)-dependent dehydrogenase (short-subunit alcohol dehydrogenase family)